MKRFAAAAGLALACLTMLPASAAADVTAFLGAATTPSSRPAKGIAIGIGLILVGFEFEYAIISEEEKDAAPALTTGMGNLVLMTPTNKLQFYGTTGGGLFRERYRERNATNFGTNIGGGVKVALAGPIKLRVDYRIFRLNGTQVLYKTVKRMYAGLSLSF
jgi:opacity protein-like surface antigen